MTFYDPTREPYRCTTPEGGDGTGSGAALTDPGDGGEVIAHGTLADLMENPASLMSEGPRVESDLLQGTVVDVIDGDDLQLGPDFREPALELLAQQALIVGHQRPQHN